MRERITSSANPRVKAYSRLKLAKERRQTGLFLIEGDREIERAVAAGVKIETMLVCPELLAPGQETVFGAGAAAATIELAEAAFRKIALRRHPPATIAVARQFETALAELRLRPNPLVLVVEHVEKPGNLGAMLRTADAVGVDGVVVAAGATDVFNPNVIRASQGSLFNVPLAVAAADETIEWIRLAGLEVIGGYPDAATDLWETDMTRPTAILVGAEDVGVSPAWRDIAQAVRIPMRGRADSLNASVSAAVLLFEAIRQRSA